MPSGAFAACRNTKCAKPCQDMSCLGSVTAAMPTATTYKVTVAPADYQSGKPLLMATVKQCKRVDPDCLMPVDTQTVDAMGKVTFAAVATSPKGLDDYFEITAPMYEPTILFDVATSSLDDADGMTLAPLIITTATFKLLTGVIGATSDPTRGHITFLALACKGNRAAGVSVTADTADAMTTRTYIAGALPSKTAMETDASGSGAFINVPVGPVALTGTLVSSAKLLGTNAVFVRAGFITAANVIPTP